MMHMLPVCLERRSPIFDPEDENSQGIKQRDDQYTKNDCRRRINICMTVWQMLKLKKPASQYAYYKSCHQRTGIT